MGSRQEIVLLVLAGCFAIVGCGGAASKPPGVKLLKLEDQPRYLLTAVGEVSSYEPDSGIIMVRKFGGIRPKESDVYITSSTSGNSANISFSGIQRPVQAARLKTLRKVTVETASHVVRYL